MPGPGWKQVLESEDQSGRTVLWGWISEALNAEELDGVDRILTGLEGELGRF